MKQFRAFFAITALLLAFGAALASNSSFTYYEWRETIFQCVAHSYYIDGCTIRPSDRCCTILVGGDIIQLRNNNVVENQCGQALFRVP
jgi:hypothetical protein